MLLLMISRILYACKLWWMRMFSNLINKLIYLYVSPNTFSSLTYCNPQVFLESKTHFNEWTVKLFVFEVLHFRELKQIYLDFNKFSVNFFLQNRINIT